MRILIALGLLSFVAYASPTPVSTGTANGTVTTVRKSDADESDGAVKVDTLHFGTLIMVW